MISKSLLFSFGPFFAYPWKPIINLLFGTTYPIAFKNFWEQHRDFYNILWHVVCLFFQIFSNFAFLSAVDDYLSEFYYFPGLKIISLLSGSLWVLSLLSPKECPLICKMGSIICIYAALKFNSKFSAQDIELAAFCGFAVVWFYSLLKEGFILRRGSYKFIIGFSLKILSYVYFSKHYSGYLQEYTSLCFISYFSIIVLCSSLPEPLGLKGK